MKITQSDRVVYENNPLAEVICQVRFQRVSTFDDGLPEELVGFLRGKGFEVFTEEQVFSIAVALSPATTGSIGQPAPVGKVFHASTSDGHWKVSVCAEFLALTCTRYLNWFDFYPRFVECSESVLGLLHDAKTTRVGLRYKDLIEREKVGLDGVPWHELIAPFLLGPLSVGGLSTEETLDESSFGNFVSQATLRLDDCSLLLQSALLRTTDGGRTAFLIDADFFVEAANSDGLYDKSEDLVRILTKLHNNAGSLFHRGITEKLHDALGPKPT